MKKQFISMFLGILVIPVCAQVKLPAIFGDNMVLQQKSDVGRLGMG